MQDARVCNVELQHVGGESLDNYHVIEAGGGDATPHVCIYFTNDLNATTLVLDRHLELSWRANSSMHALSRIF